LSAAVRVTVRGTNPTAASVPTGARFGKRCFWNVALIASPKASLQERLL
jgi:hypothetical protein